MSDYRICRKKIVGWDKNPPEPFPGYGGTVGLGQDLAVCANSEWLLVFHAGYWHMSAATPFIVPADTMKRFRANGIRDIDAPNGGRVMAIRSSDKGDTWSQPITLYDGPLDSSPLGMTKLSDGTLVMLISEQASWYGLNQAPPEHLSVNTRVGVMRSQDHGHTWTDPVWLESPYRFYQRAYTSFLELPDGGILVPTYSTEKHDAQLHGAVHRSDDGGVSWRLIGTIQRDDGLDLDEPTITRLHTGQLMMLSRPDAAVFYSDDEGANWSFSHHAPFAPFKAHRTTTLSDGTAVCWMTSSGTLRASWSTDNGKTWRLNAAGKPFSLDPDCYGYPGGCLLNDESVMAVYYDAANRQQRTSVWGVRFKIDASRRDLEILPAPGVNRETDDVTRQNEQTAPVEIDIDVM